jgi:DNA-binding response OmpR family regulator
MSHSILLIDDDVLLRRSLSYTLERAGYAVRSAGTAVEALQLARTAVPDLVLLDIGLPGMDGFDALHSLRREHQVSIILLTARRSEQDEMLGLTLGADDYVKKPYDTDVLLARIAAVLRRTHPMLRGAATGTRTGVLHVGNLEIDPHARTVRAGDQALDITPRAFELLYLLASRPNEVVPVSEILSKLWGTDFSGEPQVLYVHIRWLRERLAEAACCSARIVTAHRVGYKLVAENC